MSLCSLKHAGSDGGGYSYKGGCKFKSCQRVHFLWVPEIYRPVNAIHKIIFGVVGYIGKSNLVPTMIITFSCLSSGEKCKINKRGSLSKLVGHKNFHKI